MERVHPPAPHYYLHTLGTRRVSQGHGVGSAVLAPMLDRCDREGVPAYLESSNPRNVAFYARHGFETQGRVPLPDGAPPITRMWREPRCLMRRAAGPIARRGAPPTKARFGVAGRGATEGRCVMASGLVRDLADLEPGLVAWLRHRHPERVGLRVEVLRHVSAGLSNETILVDLVWGDRPERRSLALRLPALQMTFPDFDLRTQALVQTAVADAGLPTPAPVAVELDEEWLGTPFLAMPFVAGQVGPQAPALDPGMLELGADRQRRVVDRFVDLLASLHRVDADPRRAPGRCCAAAGERSATRWTGGASTSGGPATATTCRCRSTSCWPGVAPSCPTATPAVSLLWGDPRLGNTIVDAEQRIVAALDWDMAFAGPAEHDLAWYLGLDAVVAALAGRQVPGFPTRAETLARYEQRAGRRLVDFDWYEVFALVRSIAVAVRQSRLAAAAGVDYPVPAPDHNPVIPYTWELIARLG